MNRTRIAILAACMTIAPAAAQMPPTDDMVPLRLSRPMIQSIGNALMKAPYETSAPILQELQRQLDDANRAAAEAGGAAKAAAEGKTKPASPEPSPTPSPGQ